MSRARKILFVLVSLVMVFTPIGIASAKTYDFTNMPLLHEAFKGYDDQSPADSSPDHQELIPGEYTAISAPDNNRAAYTCPEEFKYEFHRFIFQIQEEPSVISQIYVRHEGYGKPEYNNYGLDLYIWNYNDTQWELVGSHFCETDCVTEATYTSGFTNYIDTNGYLQLLAETKFHTASCPYLYTWNGTGFEFVTDFNTPGGLGYYDASVAQPYLPKSEDYVEIAGSQLKAVDGSYRLELAEDQDEVVYFDQVKLLVVDHPQGTEIYTPTMTKFAQPYPFKVYTIGDPKPPISAVDDNGVDILPVISEIDRIYTDGEDFHWDAITLDPGDLSGAKEIKLVFNAYMDWPLIPDIAARYMTEEYRARVEVINEYGEWQEVSMEEPLGLPQAKPRTYVIDITNWFEIDDYRIRISYWEKALFDYIVFDTSEDEEVLVNESDPVSADLHWKGVAQEFSPDGRKPLIADYYTTVNASGFEPFAGNFTRYGDVLPLLTEVDDKFVIMHAGDDISLTFNEVPASEGMERDYFLFSDAYYKLHFVRILLGEDISRVEPLPFHGMSAYPYPDDEGYPYDAEHIAYLEEYNTREVVSLPPGESGHHTIYTDYIKVEVELLPPDLVVSKSVTTDAHGNFTVSYNVTNIGDGPAGNSTTRMVADGLEKSQPCPPLGPGDSYNGQFDPESCPCLCGATVNVTVCADWDYDVVESNEGNNCELNYVECVTAGVHCSDVAVTITNQSVTDDPASDPATYDPTNRPPGVTWGDAKGFCVEASAPNGTYEFCINFETPVRTGFTLYKLPDWTEVSYIIVGPNTIQVELDISGGILDPCFILAGKATPPGVPTVNHWGIVAITALFAGLLVWAVRRRRLAS
jgi:hypothetical protein